MEQTSLDALNDDPTIASVQRRTEAVAAKEIDLSFDSIASGDIVKTVYGLSNQDHELEWTLTLQFDLYQSAWLAQEPSGVQSCRLP